MIKVHSCLQREGINSPYIRVTKVVNVPLVLHSSVRTVGLMFTTIFADSKKHLIKNCFTDLFATLQERGKN